MEVAGWGTAASAPEPELPDTPAQLLHVGNVEVTGARVVFYKGAEAT